MMNLRLLILEKIKSHRMGDPLERETKLGPLAHLDLRDRVHQQVRDSIEHGATLEAGGEIPANKGFYYPLTILSNVKSGQPAFDEEIFGRPRTSPTFD